MGDQLRRSDGAIVGGDLGTAWLGRRLGRVVGVVEPAKPHWPRSCRWDDETTATCASRLDVDTVVGGGNGLQGEVWQVWGKTVVSCGERQEASSNSSLEGSPPAATHVKHYQLPVW